MAIGVFFIYNLSSHTQVRYHVQEVRKTVKNFKETVCCILAGATLLVNPITPNLEAQ